MQQDAETQLQGFAHLDRLAVGAAGTGAEGVGHQHAVVAGVEPGFLGVGRVGEDRHADASAVHHAAVVAPVGLLAPDLFLVRPTQRIDHPAAGLHRQRRGDSYSQAHLFLGAEIEIGVAAEGRVDEQERALRDPRDGVTTGLSTDQPVAGQVAIENSEGTFALAAARRFDKLLMLDPAAVAPEVRAADVAEAEPDAGVHGVVIGRVAAGDRRMVARHLHPAHLDMSEKWPSDLGIAINVAGQRLAADLDQQFAGLFLEADFRGIRLRSAALAFLAVKEERRQVRDLLRSQVEPEIIWHDRAVGGQAFDDAVAVDVGDLAVGLQQFHLPARLAQDGARIDPAVGGLDQAGAEPFGDGGAGFQDRADDLLGPSTQADVGQVGRQLLALGADAMATQALEAFHIEEKLPAALGIALGEDGQDLGDFRLAVAGQQRRPADDDEVVRHCLVATERHPTGRKLFPIQAQPMVGGRQHLPAVLEAVRLADLHPGRLLLGPQVMGDVEGGGARQFEGEEAVAAGAAVVVGGQNERGADNTGRDLLESIFAVGVEAGARDQATLRHLVAVPARHAQAVDQPIAQLRLGQPMKAGRGRGSNAFAVADQHGVHAGVFLQSDRCLVQARRGRCGHRAVQRVVNAGPFEAGTQLNRDGVGEIATRRVDREQGRWPNAMLAQPQVGKSGVVGVFLQADRQHVLPPQSVSLRQGQQTGAADAGTRISNEGTQLFRGCHLQQGLPGGIEGDAIGFPSRQVDQRLTVLTLAGLADRLDRFEAYARLGILECRDHRLRQLHRLAELPQPMGQDADRLEAQVEVLLRSSQLGEEPVDGGIRRRDPAQRPGGPGLAGARQIGLPQQANQVFLHHGAAANQLLLGIDAPHRNVVAQVLRQLGEGPALVGLDPLRHVPGRAGDERIARGNDAKDSAFVLLLPVLPLGAVVSAPAKHIEGAIGTNFDIGRLEERLAAGDEFLQLAAGRLQEGAIPVLPIEIDALPSPVVDEEDVAIPFGEVICLVVDDAGAGAFEERSAGRHGRQVPIAAPVITPGMAPAEVGAEERHEDLVALVLVIVGAEPVEGVVEGDVPGIANARGDDLEILAEVVAAKHAALTAPVVGRVVIGSLVVVLLENADRRKIGGIGRRLHCPEVAERLGRDPLILGQAFRVALRHVQLAVGPPVEAVQTVLQVAQVRVNLDVLIGLVVAVQVADDRQVWRVGDPEVAAFPGQGLDAVEAGGEGLDLVGHAVAVGVGQDDDAVGWRIGLGKAKLRPLADEEPAADVERHRRRIADRRLTSEELDAEAIRNLGHFQRTGLALRGMCHGQDSQEKQGPTHDRPPPTGMLVEVRRRFQPTLSSNQTQLYFGTHFSYLCRNEARRSRSEGTRNAPRTRSLLRRGWTYLGASGSRHQDYLRS